MPPKVMVPSKELEGLQEKLDILPGEKAAARNNDLASAAKVRHRVGSGLCAAGCVLRRKANPSLSIAAMRSRTGVLRSL